MFSFDKFNVILFKVITSSESHTSPCLSVSQYKTNIERWWSKKIKNKKQWRENVPVMTDIHLHRSTQAHLFHLPPKMQN